jgi:glutathione S-transferase
VKLYSGPLSLFTAKVRVALDEKGLDYERCEVAWSLEAATCPTTRTWRGSTRAGRC